MLVLIILLACLVSILMITLLNITAVNTQVILFLIVLIAMILFKLILDRIVKRNNINPVSKNIISNINLENQTPKDNVMPHNFNNIMNNTKVNGVNANANANANANLNSNANANLNSNANANANQRLNNNSTNLTDEDLSMEIVNDDLNVFGNKVANNTNENLVNNLVNSNANTNTNTNTNNAPNHSCLLENCPCAEIGQKTCCGSVSTNRTPCGNCPAAKLVNGESVNSECLKNNTENYADVFNANTNLNENRMNIPGTECAFDNSCITNPDSGNLHIAPPKLSPGDPDFTNEEEFWNFNVNRSDMCYIRREVPQFKCSK
jgi:hypothetical protein